MYHLTLTSSLPSSLVAEHRLPNRQVDKEIDKKYDDPNTAHNHNHDTHNHTGYVIESDWVIDERYEATIVAILTMERNKGRTSEPLVWPGRKTMSVPNINSSTTTSPMTWINP